MQGRTKVFQREELYERVWTTPMRKLAQEFKYSDVGLAKLCRKHQIPTPGIGYWRKVDLEYEPPRERLPAIAQNGPYTICLTLRDSSAEERKPAPQEMPVISVAFNAPLSHPAVIRSERLLRTARKDDKSLLVPRKGSVEHLQVTEAQLSRALSILDALLGALEERNIRVVWPKDEGAVLSLDCGSEKIGLCLSEILDSKPHVVTVEEEARRNGVGPGLRPNATTRRREFCGSRCFATKRPPCAIPGRKGREKRRSKNLWAKLSRESNRWCRR